MTEKLDIQRLFEDIVEKKISDNSLLLSVFQLFEASLEASPSLSALLGSDASKLPLIEYAAKITQSSSEISPTLKTIIEDGLQRYYPNLAFEDFDILPTAIDTSTHGGILSLHETVQSYLLIAHGLREHKKMFISFPCEVVPLNNGTWPRGFWYQGHKESIFLNKMDKVLLHTCPPFNKKWFFGEQRHDIALERRKWLYDAVEKLPNIFSSTSYPTFSHQYVAINQTLWRLTAEEKLNLPPLYQIPLEDITTELLINSFQSGDVLAEFLFNETLRQELLNTFEGIHGAWKSEKGTHFFWGADHKNHQARLHYENGFLLGRNIKIEMTPEAIVDSLSAKQIAPCVLLSLLSAMLHGVECLGGYHQVSYLPAMHEKARSLFKAHGFNSEAAAVEKLRPSQLSCGPLFLFDDAYPFDMSSCITIGKESFASIFENALSSYSCAKTLLCSLPSIYHELVDFRLQNGTLRKIKEGDIAKMVL